MRGPHARQKIEKREGIPTNAKARQAGTSIVSSVYRTMYRFAFLSSTLARRAIPTTALGLALALLGCGRRDPSAAPKPQPQAKPQSPPSPAPLVPLSQWVEPNSSMVMRWRPPLRNATLLSDLFAFPARAGSLYQSSQARIQDAERLFGHPLKDPEMVAFRGAQGPIAVLRSPQAYQDFDPQMAKSKIPVHKHHEWSCAELPSRYPQALCKLDKPDLAWVHRGHPDLDLENLRRSRDLPNTKARKALQEAAQQHPEPTAILFSFAPTLHLELDQDPTFFQWELFSFGRPDARGIPGWRGHSTMQHPDPTTASRTLKSAAGLEDNPQAQTLRQRAHVEQGPAGRVEIRLEVHGDAPTQP